MTQDDARRSLEASTDFEFRAGRVWLRQVRWLRAVADLASREAVRGAIAGAERTADLLPIGPSRAWAPSGGWSADPLP
jgi:hypothetical protein